MRGGFVSMFSYILYLEGFQMRGYPSVLIMIEVQSIVSKYCHQDTLSCM